MQVEVKPICPTCSLTTPTSSGSYTVTLPTGFNLVTTMVTTVCTCQEFCGSPLCWKKPISAP